MSAKVRVIPLSRRKQGFESPRERQLNNHLASIAAASDRFVLNLCSKSVCKRGRSSMRSALRFVSPTDRRSSRPNASTPESFARTKIAFPVVGISMPPLGERGASSTKTLSIAISESRLRGDFEEYCAASGNVAVKIASCSSPGRRHRIRRKAYVRMTVGNSTPNPGRSAVRCRKVVAWKRRCGVKG
jgi:hypothetical protein